MTADWCIPNFDTTLDSEMGYMILSNKSGIVAGLDSAAKAVEAQNSRRDTAATNGDSDAGSSGTSWVYASSNSDSDSPTPYLSLSNNPSLYIPPSTDGPYGLAAFKIDFGLPQTAQSPWGPAYKIFSWSTGDGGNGGSNGGMFVCLLRRLLIVQVALNQVVLLPSRLAVPLSQVEVAAAAAAAAAASSNALTMKSLRKT